MNEPVAEPVRKALDSNVDLLAALAECTSMIAFWEEELKKTKARLADVMGDAEQGTINGEPVFFYERQNRFRGGDFAKAYPDMYKFYTRDKTIQRFDEEWFRSSRPDLWKEFQSRPMRSTWTPPGERKG